MSPGRHVIPASSLAPSSMYCVGKNYRQHAEEMLQWEKKAGAASQTTGKPDEPIIFLKPPTALSSSGCTSIPCFLGKPVSSNMHYEAELVVLIGRDAEEVSAEDAMEYVGGYGVGLDMTLRDVQMDAREKGEPWLKCKGFKNSALVSDLVPRDRIPDPDLLSFEFSLNGRIVQQGKPAEMLFNIPLLISYLSYIYGLRAGDLLFTGTPAGVGKVSEGDTLHAELFLNSSGSTTLLTTLDARVQSCSENLQSSTQ